MSLSTTIESNVNSLIEKYGSSITILQQTGNVDANGEVPTWTDGSTTETKAIIIPLEAKREPGLNWENLSAGLMQETLYWCFIKATETVEESASESGGTITNTRYLITYNGENYEIIKNDQPDMQSNVLFKRLIIRKKTS